MGILGIISGAIAILQMILEMFRKTPEQIERERLEAEEQERRRRIGDVNDANRRANETRGDTSDLENVLRGKK